MRTGISGALRKAFGMDEGQATESGITENVKVPSTPSYKAVPVAPPASPASPREGLDTLVPTSEVLKKALRPRVVSRSGKINWDKVLERFRRVYDRLAYFIRRGNIRGKETAGNFDLVEVFYEIFPEARGQVHSLPVYVSEYVVDLDSLEKALDPKGPIYKTYFSRLVDIPGTLKASVRKGGSPEFFRLREEVTRAYLALVEPKGSENYVEILRRFMEAYLSYAYKLPSLPKPGVEQER
jgi:hypothetical protein